MIERIGSQYLFRALEASGHYWAGRSPSGGGELWHPDVIDRDSENLYPRNAHRHVFYWMEGLWNRLHWNPAVVLQWDIEDRVWIYSPSENEDPNATPKPSWDDVKRAWAVYWANFPLWWSFRRDTDRHANVPVHLGDVTLHVGDGIDRMGGLHYHHGKSGQPGVLHRRSVLKKDDDHGTVDLWTRIELESVLDQVAGNRDRAESARNIVRATIDRKASEIKSLSVEAGDTSLGAEVREEKQASVEAAYIEMKTMIENGPAEIERIFRELASDDDLPPDEQLDTLRAVLITRLSTAANQARNKVLAVIDAQDAYLPASCIEQEEATRQIAAARQSGFNDINAAEVASGMKDAFDQAVESINAVRVLNTPVFADVHEQPLELVDGEVVVDFPFDPDEDSGTLFSFRVGNPTPSGDRTPESLGTVVIEPLVQERLGDPWNGRLWSLSRQHPIGAAPQGHLSYQYLTLPPPDETFLTITARNSCGPSDLRVRIRRTDPE